MKRIPMSETRFLCILSFVWGFSIGIILIRMIG